MVWRRTMSINAVSLRIGSESLTSEVIVDILGTDDVEIRRKGEPVSPRSSAQDKKTFVIYRVLHGWPEEKEERLPEFISKLEPFLVRIAESELKAEMTPSVWVAATGREQGNVAVFESEQLRLLTDARARLVFDTYSSHEE